jgi:hypothetical protein
LFERFSKFSLKTNDRHGLEHLLLDNEIRKATEEAKRMSCEIKDIRDELNILKSVAQFQRDVEQKLSTNDSSKTGSRNSSLRANYVVEDVSQMDRVSLRIQSSVSPRQPSFMQVFNRNRSAKPSHWSKVKLPIFRQLCQ